MPKKKRKKYPRLPSGFGTIRYLGNKRRNCYAVHPPTTIDALGHINRPAALCYTDDWIKGFAVLTAYKAGSYTPGMERELEIRSSSDADILIQRIISDYSTIKGVEEKHPEVKKLTFEEVYNRFIKWKFENPKKKPLSKQARYNYNVAFKNCTVLHNRPFCDLKAPDLQEVIDNCPLKHSSLELILTLFKQMYKYAIIEEICREDKSAYVVINIPDDDEHGVPFSDSELDVLWKNCNDEDVQMILIMCYSGFRLTAYKSLEVNLEERYFRGGIKTSAGKNRFVPIHPSIYGFTKYRISKYGSLLPYTASTYRSKSFYPALERLGIEKGSRHTPHDCRHTFSMLCEKYSVRENDRKRMLGHAFKDDITNSVYGHRSVEDLRIEIEKIHIPDFVTLCDLSDNYNA